jgi:FtsH-binding integral membrane protein
MINKFVSVCKEMVNFGKLLKKKEPFLIKTYALLIVQLAITFSIVLSFRNNEKLHKLTKQNFWVYLLLTLGILLIMIFVPMPPYVKIFLFTLFAVVFGGMLHNASVKVGSNIIESALIGTITIFITMSIFAFVLASIGVDLSFMMIILFAALFGLIIANVIVYFFAKESQKIKKYLLLFGLVLFSIFVMVYTNTILQPGYTVSSIDAALNFYLDFVNIYSNLFQL